MSDMTRGTKKTGGSNKCYETWRLKHDTDRVEDRRNKPSDEKEKQYQQNNKIKTGTRNSVKCKVKKYNSKALTKKKTFTLFYTFKYINFKYSKYPINQMYLRLAVL